MLTCCTALSALANTSPEAPLVVVASWTPTGEAVEWVPPTSAPAYYNVYGIDASGVSTWLVSTASHHVSFAIQFPRYAVTAVSASGAESNATQSPLLGLDECFTLDPTGIPPFYFGSGPCEAATSKTGTKLTLP